MEYKGKLTAFELFKEHDGIVITAWRYTDGCGTEGNIIPKSKKLSDNKKLQRDLKDYDYDFALGHFVEGDMHVIEDVFVVYDTNNTGKLTKLGVQLGKKYNQYSVLLIKGGKAYLHGTNHCHDAIPEYDKTTTPKAIKEGTGSTAWTTILKSGENFTV